LDFIAQNVGIANVKRSALIPLIIRKLDDLRRFEGQQSFTFYHSIPNRSAIRNMVIRNYLHQLGCSWHRACCYTSFARRTEISNFSRTLLRHFRSTINNASGTQSEVTCFLAGGEVMLMLFRAAKSSISRLRLLCSSALDCNLVCERPGPWYRRAVFISDDLAVDGSPR
jgi:hypothetical protein